ncbi:PTS sugar transporter subunit IIA [candidate division KSB1 bacterium]|nr:PTS sugar transporter subunit IIA [candidate division KSB1 bacterium]RQW02886.1 MAG: PTS sugar transporter subunit IIA [candidate division KSB1 bacterium]
MRVIDYMRDSLIILDMEARSQKEAITKIVTRMNENGAVSNAAKFLDSVLERESLGSTAIGNGIALPHARTPHIDSIVIAFVRLQEGIDFKAADGEPVRLLFLLGTPMKAVGEYLSVLEKLSKILKQSKIRQKLLKATTAPAVRSIFEHAEA